MAVGTAPSCQVVAVAVGDMDVGGGQQVLLPPGCDGGLLLLPSPCTAGVVSSLLPPGSMLRPAPLATVVSSLLPCGKDGDGDGLVP